jgi:hypothetical protein
LGVLSTRGKDEALEQHGGQTCHFTGEPKGGPAKNEAANRKSWRQLLKIFSAPGLDMTITSQLAFCNGHNFRGLFSRPAPRLSGFAALGIASVSGLVLNFTSSCR